MNTAEMLYARGSTLLRDISQYLLYGILAVGGFTWAWHAATAPDPEHRLVDGLLATVKILFDLEPRWPSVVFTLVLAYMLGKMMFSLGHGVCGLVDWLTPGRRQRTVTLETRLRDELHRALTRPRPAPFAHDEDQPPHLYWEVFVFDRKPDLHARFVERYNMLMNGRCTMSGLMVVQAAVFAAVLQMQGVWFAALAVALALWFALSWQRLYTEFLERIAATAAVTVNTDASASKPTNR